MFVSYVQENRELVARLVQELRSRNVNVWFDRDALPPGVFWRDEIRKAVSGHEYFLACFSQEYATRERTYMNEELELAIEEIRLRGTAPWFIPLLFSGEVPDRSIGGGRTLRDIQFVDFRSNRWLEAVEQIAGAVLGERDFNTLPAAIVDERIAQSFWGARQQATDPFGLESGLWHAELSHSGGGHFSAWLLNSDGDRVSLLANETGQFRGSKLIALERAGQFVLDVSATDAWSVDLVRPVHSSALPRIAGQCQAATPLIPFSRGLYKFRLSHQGTGHFAAWIYDSGGKRLHLLANETGQFSGSKAVQLTAGEFAFDVSASGPWSITWR